MISQPISSIFLCSPLPSGTWRTQGLTIPWCSRPTSSSVCLVFFHLPLCLARWSWPDPMNGIQQDTTHLIQTPCYQRGSPCQDTAVNRTTRRPLDHRKETQTAVAWSCLPFIRSGQTILQGTVKGGRRQGRQEEVGGQHQGMDRPGVRQVPEGSGEQGKMEKSGFKIICGAPTTLAVLVS